MKRALLGLFVFLLCYGQASADKAVVVGVNSYPNLKNADLTGCLNDAKRIVKILEGRGYKVLFLENPPKERVVGALESVKKSIGQKEDFVFYFSGHGSGPAKPSILTSSALATSLAGDITSSELNSLISSFPCKNKSVLLDSCFSGAMMKSILPEGWRSKFYPRALSKSLTKVNKSDSTAVFSGQTTGVCYFVAARSNETAIEKTIQGARRGVFTFFLERELGKSNSWGELQSMVSAKVIQFLQDRQHPTLTAKYRGLRHFGQAATQSSGSSPSVSQPQTLWQIFNTDSVDENLLTMTMSPNKTTMQVGQRLTFQVKAGAPGYLLIAERGTSGRVNLIYPLDGQIGTAKVQANQVVKIPGGDQAWAPDEPGSERLRAFLFKSESAANELLNALVRNKGRSLEEFSRSSSTSRASGKDLRLTSAGNGGNGSGFTYQFPYYTSDVHFLVVE